MVITLNDVDKGNRCRIAEYHGSFEGSTQQGYRWKVEPKPYPDQRIKLWAIVYYMILYVCFILFLFYGTVHVKIFTFHNRKKIRSSFFHHLFH